MSAIASFNKLPKSSLDALRQAAAVGSFDSFMQQQGNPVLDYEGSGYVFGTLLPYLEMQHQLVLMKSEHDELATFLCKSLQATCFIFTDTHRQKYLAGLTHEAFSEVQLRDYFNEFNAVDEPDAGKWMLSGIQALRDSLNTVDHNSVVILSIG